ncbi:putative Ig domain-containing protein [Rhodococcus fascians]|nr:putative Ig domain-containing protein [Rhodococcus fascians]MBY4237789.1 putative Ig domain-containing protein [Rhodococcus fascians]MBY4253992.1 putative Ig domain-containing protein [Rhodococcus fascians]MBY4269137.1 putative Ig domain-containing protein [Rhodococcus fascians]
MAQTTADTRYAPQSVATDVVAKADNTTVAATAANTARLLSKLTRNVEDACYLYVSDSTGNELTEHVYLELMALAARFPAYTVQYYLWNDTTKAYDSAVVVQTGTGSKVLRLYNLAIPGSQPAHFLDTTRWGPGVASLPNIPDVIFISHGHNMGSVDTENSQQGCRNTLLQFTEEVSAHYPNAGMVLMSQNPTYILGRETWQAIKARIWQDVAAQRGYGFIDVHEAFRATGNAVDYVDIDNIHPTKAAPYNGSLLWANTVIQALNYDPRSTASAGRPSAFVEPARNLITNGDFSTWSNSSAPPDGWTALNATVSKDTVNFETGTYGLRVVGGAADGLSGIEWVVNPANVGIRGYVDGKVITVKVRVRVPAHSTVVALIVTDQTGGTNQRRTDLAQFATARFVWLSVTKRLSAAPTLLRVQVCCRVLGTSGGDMTIDRSDIVEGNLPLAGAYLPTPSSLDAQLASLMLDSSSALRQAISALVSPTAPAITTSSVPNPSVGVAYTATLAATGTAPITWAISSGALPAGLSLSTGGVISGTPTASGSFSVTVSATNSAGTVTRVLAMTVVADAAASWTIDGSDGFSGDGSTGLYQRTSDAALGGAAANWTFGSTQDRTRCNGQLIAGPSLANTLYALPLTTPVSKVSIRIKQKLTSLTTTQTVFRMFASRSGTASSGQSEIGLQVIQTGTDRALSMKLFMQDAGGTATAGVASIPVVLDDEVGVSVEGAQGSATLRLWKNGAVVAEETYAGTLPSALRGVLAGHATDSTWQLDEFKTYAHV